jgi:hypothetical protein
MTVAAAGCVSLTLDKFRDTLAASATFKELMGATTAAEAKAVTWWLETDDQYEESQSVTPRSVVGFSMGMFEGEKQTQSSWGVNSPLELLLEVDTPAEYTNDLQNGLMWWTNKIGALIDEVKVLANSGGGYSNVVSFGLDFACRGDPERNNGKLFYAAGLTVKVRGM